MHNDNTRALPRRTLWLTAGLLLVTAGWAWQAHAQAGEPAKDPARWYQQDLTPAGRMATLKKEAGAALQEARAECRLAAQTQRSNCRRQARAAYVHDMDAATQLTGLAWR